MKRSFRILLALAALAVAALACNLPARDQPGQPTPLPAPNQTLTALFAIATPDERFGTPDPTDPATATVTLPPVLSPTPAVQDTAVPLPTTAPTAAPTAALPTTVPTVGITYVAPTATRAPVQASPTAAARRTSFQAQYLNTPPTIDGDWSEWKDVAREYPANYVTYGAANRTGDDDLAASFYVGWDNDRLYIAVKVRDDRYVQNASGENLYLGDSLEILLDTKLEEDFYYSELSADDFQLGISPGRPDPDGTREAYLWFPRSITGPRTNITIASRLENGVYRVEAAIPWNVFETTPAVGKRFGFVLSVSDNDDPTQNLQQSMVSSSPGRRLTDPTTWGELELVR
jgi:hypothetical protein